MPNHPRTSRSGDHPYPAPVAGPTVVTRDGTVVARVEDSDEAFGYILRSQGQSVCHAVTWEGWGWRAATEAEIAEHPLHSRYATGAYPAPFTPTYEGTR
jgi:hypothetical protein